MNNTGRLKLMGFLLPLALLSSILHPQSSMFGERYALILGGIGGQPEFTETYLQQTSRMYQLLTGRFDYDPKNITYLFEKPELDTSKIDYQATAENVRQAFAQLGRNLKENDQLFIFMVGHGSYDGDWCKFNLVGADLRDIDFTQLLDSLPTKKIILVNATSASGPFVERLSAAERVVITATKSGQEHFATNFSDFFLDALSSEDADVNKDQRISMAEAFSFAKSNQDKWFEEKRRIRSEHALLDDNGDGKGSPTLDAANDGTRASRVYLGPVSAEWQGIASKAQSGQASPTDKLRMEKLALEQQIEDLKAKKAQMSSEVYSRELETLLVRLAKLNKEIKEKPGN
ncbi:MAG TPA: C13 family peptidase [bacterium]